MDAFFDYRIFWVEHRTILVYDPFIILMLDQLTAGLLCFRIIFFNVALPEKVSADAHAYHTHRAYKHPGIKVVK